MATLDAQIAKITELQDVELTNAVAQMRQAGTLASYLANQRQQLFDAVSKEHSDSFQKVYGDFQRGSNGQNDMYYYYVRNKDLENIQKTWIGYAKDQVRRASQLGQTGKRQFEINEWTSGNKQDTLFFLQVLFIALTLLAPLVYLNRIGMLPSGPYYFVSGFVSIALLLTLLVRFQYTRNQRNRYFWNRRIHPSAQVDTNEATKCSVGLDALQDQLAEIGGTIGGGIQNASSLVAGAATGVTAGVTGALGTGTQAATVV